MKRTTSTRTRALALLLLALAATGGVSAQDAYPSRAIKMVVAQPPGNSADLVARMISERLSRAIGQAVVVENKPGASGSIGVAAIASAPADGYTIGIGGIGQLALNPTLYSRLPYDAQNGFTTIAIVYRGPMLFMVDPASPVTSMKDLVQQSQASPREERAAAARAAQIDRAGNVMAGEARVLDRQSRSFCGDHALGFVGLVAGDDAESDDGVFA